LSYEDQKVKVEEVLELKDYLLQCMRQYHEQGGFRNSEDIVYSGKLGVSASISVFFHIIARVREAGVTIDLDLVEQQVRDYFQRIKNYNTLNPTADNVGKISKARQKYKNKGKKEGWN
jgi:hypothetical protein